MANIIKTLTNRVIEARGTNKGFPCNVYRTERAAEVATEAMAQVVATHFDVRNDENARPADYVVFYVHEWDRWVGCINLTEVMSRKSSTGGYLGIAKGFFAW